MELIRIDTLKPGMVVARSITDAFGRTLISKNVVLTKLAIRRLNELGITKVYIENEETANIELNVDDCASITPEQKREVIKALRTVDVDKIVLESKKIVDKMSQNQGIMTNMDNIRTYDDYTYEHSVSVALMSSTLGLALKYNTNALDNLVCAALLHDIGKTCIDEAILNAPRKLSADEYEEVKKHTVYGYKILSGSYDVPSTVRAAVLLHHENADGTGYPMGITNDKIYKFAQIIHICDVYDALISKRPYKQSIKHTAAMDFINENEGKMFNKLYAEIFKAVTPIYEIGVRVKLNNDCTGIVVKNHVGATLRPVIYTDGEYKDLRDKQYSDIKIIDE